jgi:hypothetical protein
VVPALQTPSGDVEFVSRLAGVKPHMIEPYYLGEFLFLVQKTVILNKKSKKKPDTRVLLAGIWKMAVFGGAKAMLAAHMG